VKKKLLITLGCSVTEGYGCYDTSTFDYIPGKEYYKYDNPYEIVSRNKDRFLTEGWPAKLQTKLKYDKLINLGLGGSSTSGQVKLFIEQFYSSNLAKDYDVLVVWLLNHEGRFSFYSNYKNVDVLPHIPYGTQEVEKFPPQYLNLSKSYVNFIEDTLYDTVLEQVFYVKLMNLVCLQKGFEFVFTSMEKKKNIEFVNAYKKLYPSEGNLFTLDNTDIIAQETDLDKWSIIGCGHPNENGYTYIADNFFKLIKKYQPKLINLNTPDKFDRTHSGKYSDFNPLAVLT